MRLIMTKWIITMQFKQLGFRELIMKIMLLLMPALSSRGLSQVLWSTGLTNMKAFTKASRQQCKNISPKHKFLNCSLLICSCDYPTKSIRYVNRKSKHLSELCQKPFASQPYTVFINNLSIDYLLQIRSGELNPSWLTDRERYIA